MIDDDVEFAETTGGSRGNFPTMWGVPRGSQWSEERAEWIKDQICRFAGLAALDQLASRDKRYLGMLRRAVVASRRNAP